MTELEAEIWKCEHHKEYYMGYDGSAREDWDNTHGELYEGDICEPEITTIPVPDLEDNSSVYVVAFLYVPHSDLRVEGVFMTLKEAKDYMDNQIPLVEEGSNYKQFEWWSEEKENEINENVTEIVEYGNESGNEPILYSIFKCDI